MIELKTEEPQKNKTHTWRLYWFHATDLDASYPADSETLAKSGFVPQAELDRATLELQQIYEAFRPQNSPKNPREVAQFIQQYRKAEAGPAWVDCRERMPLPETKVLVRYACGAPDTEIAKITPGGHWYSSGFPLHDEDVTHWMPLPDPPSRPVGASSDSALPSPLEPSNKSQRRKKP